MNGHQHDPDWQDVPLVERPVAVVSRPVLSGTALMALPSKLPDCAWTTLVLPGHRQRHGFMVITAGCTGTQRFGW